MTETALHVHSLSLHLNRSQLRRDKAAVGRQNPHTGLVIATVRKWARSAVSAVQYSGGGGRTHPVAREGHAEVGPCHHRVGNVDAIHVGLEGGRRAG